jgi:HK97 family phage major capsid protein
MQAWVLNGRGQELRDEHREACRATGINYRSNELVLNLRRDNYARMRYTYTGLEQRAGSALPQATALIASGGALVPEGFINNVEIALLQYGGIRNVADVMRTESGNDLPWPTVNDTAVKGRRLAENAQINTKDITFGVCTFRAYLYTSDIVLVPVSLIQDAAINLSNLVGSLCGERIGRIQSDEFTTHTGNAGPMGIVPAATSGVSAAVATAIAADDLYSLKHSVDPAYRKGAQFMMHDSILLAIKKLKDGMGRYLWQASLAGGSPDTLDGDPIQINQSMDSTLASGKKPVLYGQLSKYKIRDVGEIRLRRLVERYADLDQEAFLCLMRSDGNLLDAGTHPVKYIAN